jgi:hypothetical protein
VHGREGVTKFHDFDTGPLRALRALNGPGRRERRMKIVVTSVLVDVTAVLDDTCGNLIQIAQSTNG